MSVNFVKGVAHIGLDAVDTKAVAQFFIDHLGFEHYASEPFGNGTIEFVNNGNAVLEIVPAEKANKPHGQVNHFAMEVSDLDEAMTHLKSVGAKFEGDPLVLEGFLGRGLKAAFFEGPEGMRLEVFQYLS